MRFIPWCVALLCLSSWQSIDSQSSSPSPQAVLTSAISASGDSSPITASGQCTADGSTTLNAPGEVDPAPTHLAISGAGTTQLTVQASTGTRTTSYAGPAGTDTAADGSTQPVTPRTAIVSGFLYLPMLELAAIAGDSNAVLTLSGPATFNDHMAYALTVSGHWNDLSPTGQPLPTVTYYIDSTTYNVVAREDTLLDSRDSRTQYDRVIGYDDYRSSGSFTVPFKVTQTISGQLLSSTQWTSLTAAL